MRTNRWTRMFREEMGTDGAADGAAPEVEVEGEVKEPEVVTTEEGYVDTDLAFLYADEDEEPKPAVEERDGEKKEEGPAEPEAKPEESEAKPEVTEDKKPEPEKEPEPETKEVLEDKKPEQELPDEDSLKKQREDFLAEVEKSFAISEEDANLMITEPEKVLPRLATNVFDRAMTEVSKMFDTFASQLPTMMTQVSAQGQAATQAEQAFLEANPGIEAIEANELKGLVETFAPLVAKQNPKASREDKLKALGRTIAAAKGISLGSVTPPKAKEEPVVPHTPAATVRSSGDLGNPKPNSADDEFISMLLIED